MHINSWDQQDMERRILILFSFILLLNNVNTAPKKNAVSESTLSKNIHIKKLPQNKTITLRQQEYPSELAAIEHSDKHANLEIHESGTDQILNPNGENISSAELIGPVVVNNDPDAEGEDPAESAQELESNERETEDNDNELGDDDEESQNSDEESENNDKESGNNDEESGNSQDVDDNSEDDYSFSDSEYADKGNEDLTRLQLISANDKKRSVMAGDTFSPSEMLPITQKLIFKVENPGMGKGIVSSAKNPQQLADRIFEAFFLTQKRIVVLKDFDISGLDALQALALSGESAGVRSKTESMTEPPWYTFLNIRGQKVGVHKGPRKCHYRLVTKKLDIERKKPVKTKRQGIDLTKNLSKKRRLIVKAVRKNRDSETTQKPHKPSHVKAKNRVKKRSKKPVIVRHKNSKTKVFRTHQNQVTGDRRQEINMRKERKGKTEKPKSVCNWHYRCEDPANLDTCRLHTKCIKNNAIQEDNIATRDEDERNFELKQFRKMLRISIVDEEVEKILENRIATLKPGSMHESDRLQTLNEYFNSIIMAEHMRSTTPKSAAIIELSTQKRKGDMSHEGDNYNQSDHNISHEDEKDTSRATGAPPTTTPIRM